MPAFSEPATTDLCWTITILVSCALIGAILEYCAHAIHHRGHPHPHRMHDLITREIHAWHRHHQRHHRPR